MSKKPQLIEAIDTVPAPTNPESVTAEVPSDVQPIADEFPDIAQLRLSQQFLETGGAKKILATVPVRKPHRQEWVRVHKDAAFREPFAIIELKDDRERYLLMPEVAAALPAEFVTEMLYTAINRQKVVFLWPVKLPPADDRRPNEWYRSAQIAAEHATTCWVRVTSNMGLGAYEILKATGKFPEPEWPDGYSFRDLLKVAFRDRIINSFDHSVLKRLRGEC
jgi:hypothetical protein